MAEPTDPWSQFPDADESALVAQPPDTDGWNAFPDGDEKGLLSRRPSASSPYALPRRIDPAMSTIFSGQTLGEFLSRTKPMSFGLFGQGAGGASTGAAAQPTAETAQSPIQPRPNPFDARQAQMQQYVDTPYWRAFRTLIGRAEGVGYDSINNGQPYNHAFDPDTDPYPGRGAGMFQITSGTYPSLRSWFGTDDFAPSTQNWMAAKRVFDKGQMPALMRGDITSTLPTLSRVWRSLPSGPGDKGGRRKDQNVMPYANVLGIYNQALRDQLGDAE
jgi:hypothetical protein